MAGTYGTDFPETEALLAAQAEEFEAALEILNGMTATELFRLANAADWLTGTATRVGEEKQARS